MPKSKILIIDDDPRINDFISIVLKKDGYQTLAAYDAQTALLQVKSEAPDLILLDVILPDASGMDLCQQLREHTFAPIIFVSGRADDEDKIKGLLAGGDDYLTKPFNPGELLARVEANLRRASLQTKTYFTNTASEDYKEVAHLHIDFKNHTLYIDDNLVSLSVKEFAILKLFLDNPGKVFSMEDIYQTIWGHESYGDTRVIMVHISNLRKKIEEDPDNPLMITTVRGVGYKFVLPKQDSSKQNDIE